METKGKFTWGNALTDGTANRGWLIGPFKDEGSPLRDQIQIKYDHCQAGACRSRDQASADPNNRTLQILISSGRVKTTFVGDKDDHFDEVSVTLDQPGDYCLWEAGQLHYWEVLEDGTIMTVRWLQSIL